MKHSFLCIALIAAVLASCGNPQETPDTPEQPQDTTSTDIVLQDSLPALEGYQKVALKGAITKAQPMTGLVLWPDQARSRFDNYGDAIALEFSYCLPCKVVTGKVDGLIQYDWTWFENLLNDIASRNHQAIVRFRYEYPSSRDVDGVKGTTAVPAYIKQMDGYEETYSANPGGDGPTYYADWRSEELQWFTKQFYTDFAARYGEDPRIAFLEVGFGHWSEYHIYGTSLKLGVNFPSKDYQKDFFLHMAEVMPIPWLVSIDAADDDYTPVVDDSQIMDLTFGLFDDSFMHKGHEIGSSDGYNERNWNAIGKKTRWQTGVCGGEISYYTSKDQREFLNPEGLYGITWEQASAKYHISFMIANDAPSGPYGTAERFKEASIACGYRFHILDCQTNGVETQVLLKNDGVAPIYRPAYLTLGEAVDSESLQNLLPGDSRIITLKGDASKTPLTITSPAILPTQKIEWE